MNKKKAFSVPFAIIAMVFLLVGNTQGQDMASTTGGELVTLAGGNFNFLPIIQTGSTLLYSDDFSNPDSGWPINDTGDLRWSYQGGEYELRLAHEFWWIGAVNLDWGVTDNYSLEAEMHRHVGDKTALALIFDWVDWGHFYIFAIEPTLQAYVVLKIDGDDSYLLVPVTQSPLIKPGYAVNQLRIDRSESEFNVYVNNNLLAALNDTPFAGTKYFGFYGESGNSSPAELRFDNLLVKSLSGLTMIPRQEESIGQMSWNSGPVQEIESLFGEMMP